MRQNVRGGTKEEGERGRGEERRRTKEGERARGGGERAGAGTNSAKHTRDTRVGRLPKHPKLFVRTCSRDLAKAQTLLLIYAPTPTSHVGQLSSISHRFHYPPPSS